MLKGICTKQEWEQLKEDISYDYVSDVYFSELKEVEIMKERLAILSDLDPFVGKYFSINYVRTNILRQSEDDIEKMDEEMVEDAEKSAAAAEDEPPPPEPKPIPVTLAKPAAAE